jgi:hypothetical protein
MATHRGLGLVLSVLGALGCSDESAGSSMGASTPPTAAAPAATRSGNQGNSAEPGQTQSPESKTSAPPNSAVAGAASSPPAQGIAGASAAPAPPSDMTGVPVPAEPRLPAFNPYDDFSSDFYAEDSAWVCKPGMTDNPCLRGLDATEVLPDGTTKPEPAPAPTAHAIDCIYWYPTVDRSGPQSSRDFSNSEAIVGVTSRQAARFSNVCNLYVPFYRLVSISGINTDDIDLAYSDALESFKHYIANLSEGRDFVLLGHSQGANHGLRLLREELDGSPEFLRRMVSAVLLGFPVELPEGQATGGTFDNVPICQSDQQRGCLINFMSFSAASPPASGGSGGFGSIDVCTNPAALGGGDALFQGTYFQAQGSPVASSVSTPWVRYRDFFRGECKRSGGTAYLEISSAQQPGDSRDFGMLTEISGIGLHVMDFVFSQGDLIDLVAKQALLPPP